MSFSFGFNEDDLDRDDVEVKFNPSYSTDTQVEEINPSQIVDTSDLLNSLLDIKLSAEKMGSNNNIVYKRELFDIKHQVMTEDNDEINQLLLNDDLDLKKNQYEGGFKVWECSYDLIEDLRLDDTFFKKTKNIIEIGSGTSLPSCHILKRKIELDNRSELNLFLSDFNAEVLRLVTLPNLLINWYLVTKGETSEFLVNEDVITEFLNALKQLNVNLYFISGSWGNGFLSLISEYSFDLVLTCETIYSLDTLPVLSQLLIKLTNGSANHTGATTLVAAKNYYFGVGGSVIEFVNYIKANSNLQVEVTEVNSLLKRSIIKLHAS